MANVIMLSTDKQILVEGSFARSRMIEYASLFDQLHIVLVTTDISNNKTEILGNKAFIHRAYARTKLGTLWALLKKTYLVSKKGDKDCVITTQDPFEIGLAGLIVSRLRRIPLHVQIHTDLNNVYFKQTYINKIRLQISDCVLKQAQAIRVVSERILYSLPIDIKKKTRVLPIFSDLSSIIDSQITHDLAFIYPQFSKIVLSASRLTKEKDLTTALNAFALVYKEHSDIGFVIVGSGSEEDSLKKQALALGIGHAVVFEPWVSHDVLISYLKTCDVFISTSLYEGYGLSMLEAVSAGALLVATDAGIAPLITNDMCLVMPRDVSQTAEALERALTDETLVNKKYQYPYGSKSEYLTQYKNDIVRALEHI